jgi:hypothetical protein
LTVHPQKRIGWFLRRLSQDYSANLAKEDGVGTKVMAGHNLADVGGESTSQHWLSCRTCRPIIDRKPLIALVASREAIKQIQLMFCHQIERKGRGQMDDRMDRRRPINGYQH